MMNRNHLHLSVLLLLLSVPAFAQDKDAEKDKSNGLRLGYHLSDLDGDANFDARSGFYAGFYRNLIKIPLINVSAGLEYNTAGAIKDQVEVRTGYLTLPVNGRLKLGMLYFDLGLDVACNITDKVLVNGQEAASGSDVETWDALVHGGAGVKLWRLGVEARYRHGLSDAYEGYRNTGWQFGLTTFF